MPEDADALTDEMIEAAARVLFGGPHLRIADEGVVSFDWHDIGDEQDDYRKKARRIVAAALAASAPVPDA